MSRLIDSLRTALTNGALVGIVDALLLGLGITWSVASLPPTLDALMTRRRSGEAGSSSRQVGSVLIALAIALPLGSGVAGAATATEQLRGQIDRILQILDDAALRQPARAAERRELIRRAAGEIFDYAEITKRSIGPSWQVRTPAERKELVRLFSELLERTYIAKLELYSGERIKVTGERLDDDQAFVRTRIITRNNSEIPVEYRMLRHEDRWLVYDVTVEGVSLVANYRTQFSKILQTGSFDELVKRLRAKFEERPQEDARLQPAALR